MDIVCQAKSGMGKTAVFVLATLQQLDPVDNQVSVLVMSHTRELAFQVSKEYERFSKYLSNVKVAVFFGGLSVKKDEQTLKTNCPHIVVGTPGRILALARDKVLNLKHVKHFILDECDKMLEQLGKSVYHQFLTYLGRIANLFICNWYPLYQWIHGNMQKSYTWFLSQSFLSFRIMLTATTVTIVPPIFVWLKNNQHN